MNKKFEEIIQFAIKKEEEAANLYEKARGMTENIGARKMFEELAEEEWKHKEMFERLREDEVMDRQSEDVPDLKISNYLVETYLQPDMEYQKILILAMKREEKSVKLYTDMKKYAKNPILNKLLETLIQEEKKHKLRLEKEYDENILIED